MGRLSTFFILGVLVLSAGCKSGSSTGPTPSQVVIPGVGSAYVFDDVLVDSNGVVLFRDTVTLTIVMQNETIGPFNDVTQTGMERSSLPGKAFPGFMRFLQTGDVVMLVDPAGYFSEWLTLPFGSHISQSAKGDSSYTYNSGYYAFNYKYTAEYAGSVQVTATGQTIPMSKVTSNDSSVLSGIVNGAENRTDNFAYSPSTGIFGGTSGVSDVVKGSAQSVDHQTLISYSLK